MATARPTRLSSSGSTWLRPASCHHSASSSATRSGCSAARSWASAKSSSRWNSAQWSAAKSWLPGTCSRSTVIWFPMWSVVAFQPSWTIERDPMISKYWVDRGLGASAPSAANVGRRLAPSSDSWSTPSSTAGAATPAASSTVGSRSTAWANWSRTWPAAAASMPAGQWAISGVRTPPSQA